MQIVFFYKWKLALTFSVSVFILEHHKNQKISKSHLAGAFKEGKIEQSAMESIKEQEGLGGVGHGKAV